MLCVGSDAGGRGGLQSVSGVQESHGREELVGEREEAAALPTYQGQFRAPARLCIYLLVRKLIRGVERTTSCRRLCLHCTPALHVNRRELRAVSSNELHYIM